MSKADILKLAGAVLLLLGAAVYAAQRRASFSVELDVDDDQEPVE